MPQSHCPSHCFSQQQAEERRHRDACTVSKAAVTGASACCRLRSAAAFGRKRKKSLHLVQVPLRIVLPCHPTVVKCSQGISTGHCKRQTSRSSSIALSTSIPSSVNCNLYITVPQPHVQDRPDRDPCTVSQAAVTGASGCCRLKSAAAFGKKHNNSPPCFGGDVILVVGPLYAIYVGTWQPRRKLLPVKLLLRML